MIPLYDFGEVDGLPYFAMPHVRGCTLADLLVELRAAGLPAGSIDRARLQRALRSAFAGSDGGVTRGPPPSLAEPPGSWIELCARLALELAETLAHVHAAGVVHRDVKPSNVMLTVDLRGRLFDFGLAWMEGAARMTWTGDLAGTPAYASPEQVGGRRETVDGRSDVYSLGATLYELLTLHLPFEGASTQDLLRRIVRDDVRPPRRLNQRVPRHLETICTRALEKDPARRYAGAAEMARDLRRFLAGEPIRAKPVGRVRRLARRARRHPARTALALLLAAVAIGIPVGLATAGARIRHERDVAMQVVALLEGLVFDADPHELGPQTPLVDALSDWDSRIRAELAGQPVVQARLLQRLGAFLAELGRGTEGEELLRQALALQLRELGEAHADTAATLNHLGNATRSLGRPREAEALYRRALAARRSLRPREPAALAQSLLNLVGLLRELGQGSEADALEDEAQALMAMTPGADPVVRADLLRARGLRIAAAGDVRAGEELVRQAIGILRTAEHPRELNIAFAYGALGGLLRGAGRLEEAEQALRLQLAGCERLLGPHHEHTALSALFLAELEMERGDHSSAETLLERALPGLADPNAAPRLDAASCRAHLGLTKLLLGRPADAEPLLEEACRELEQLGEPGRTALAYTRARLAAARAALPGGAAIGTLDTALATLAPVHAPGTVEHVRVLLDWLQPAREIGAEALVAELLARAAASLADIQDGPPWLRGDLAYHLALQALDQGDPRSGLDLLGSALVEYRGLEGDPLGDREAAATSAMGRCLLDLELPGEARPLLERSLAAHRARSGEQHERVADALHELGRCALQEGDLAGAQAAFEASLRARGGCAREESRAEATRSLLKACLRLAGCAEEADAVGAPASAAQR